METGVHLRSPRFSASNILRVGRVTVGTTIRSSQRTSLQPTFARGTDAERATVGILRVSHERRMVPVRGIEPRFRGCETQPETSMVSGCVVLFGFSH